MFTSKVRLSIVDNLPGSIVKGDELINVCCVLCVVDKHSIYEPREDRPMMFCQIHEGCLFQGFSLKSRFVCEDLFR